MSNETIIVETKGKVGIIRLNRPQALNALNATLNAELAQAVAACDADDGIGCILITGWEYADPVVSVLIALLILASSWGILRDSTQILLEGSPSGTDVEEVGLAMASMPGVNQVHDLHVWTITSGFAALAAHVLVDRDTDCHATRRVLERMLAERFGIEHTTLQVDHEGGDLLEIELPSAPPPAEAR